MQPSIVEKHFTFEVDGVQIPAALTMPDQGAVAWGIVLVPGSFFNDMDGNYTSPPNPFQARTHVYADLARQLAWQSHAVLRYARAGTVVVDQAKAAAQQRFVGRVPVVAQACRTLREMVPGMRACAVAGHSEGSVVALLLLTQPTDVQVDAYISLSGPAQRFFDVMLRQVESSVQGGVLSFGGFQVPFALYKRSLELVRAGEPVPDDMQKSLPPFGVHAMDEGSKQYLHDYDAVEPARLMAEVTCPVLIVQGGQDTSVYPDNAEKLFEARPADTAQAFFPDLQHFYKRVPPGMPAMEAFALDSESDERVTHAISEWLSSLSV